MRSARDTARRTGPLAFDKFLVKQKETVATSTERVLVVLGCGLVACGIGIGVVEFPVLRNALSSSELLKLALAGDASALPVGVIGLGGLALSIAGVLQQLRHQSQARAEQSMPIVFVKPQLRFRLTGWSERLEMEPPCVEILVENCGETAATRLELTVASLRLTENGRVLRNLTPAERSWCRDEVLPAHASVGHTSGAARSEVDLDSMRITVLQEGDEETARLRHELVKGLAAPMPKQKLSVVMQFAVSFETIRQAKFEGGASASWDADLCRAVRPLNRQKLDALKEVLEKGGNISKFSDEIVLTSKCGAAASGRVDRFLGEE